MAMDFQKRVLLFLFQVVTQQNMDVNYVFFPSVFGGYNKNVTENLGRIFGQRTV